MNSSLVSEAVLFTAVRALPGNKITGHTPQVCMHATLANAEAAAAAPAKWEYLGAAVAQMVFYSGSPPGGIASRSHGH